MSTAEIINIQIVLAGIWHDKLYYDAEVKLKYNETHCDTLRKQCSVFV